MLKIVIDVRRIRDFGIGTYIRNLVHALAHIDSTNRYVLVTSPGEARAFAGLPPHFEVASYAGSDERPKDNLAFPWFLRRFSADLYHIPLNRVPACMPKPYVVTIHDMASLLYAEQTGIRADLHRWRFRRGLQRADRVIAVSASTRRDVQNYLGIPAERVRLVYNAPDPEFSKHGHAADARAAGPQTEERERQRVLERYQINYPFLLYAGNIRPQKNIPRLVEAFAVAHHELANHP